MKNSFRSGLAFLQTGSLSVLVLAWSVGAPEVVAAGVGGVQVRLRTGQIRDFSPAEDTDAARGEALVLATGWVNEVAKKAAEDGCVFRAGLLRHSDGNFYGTTTVGGRNDRAGVIFQMSPSGRYRVIHHFAAATGTNPRGGLVEGADGAIYGTAEGGGTSGSGVVFRVTTAGSYTALHHFDGTTGEYPIAPLCRSADGNFYGTTPHGGASGGGVIFRLAPSGEFAVLHSFSEADGIRPVAGLVEVGGALFGVTSRGGATNGLGTVFKLGPDGSFAVLHIFGGVDGAYPLGALCLGPDGMLYGTTFSGGSGFVYTSGLIRGQGTIFMISQTGGFTSVHSFGILTGRGQHPVAALTRASDGFLYGTTREGGRLNRGTVFRLGANGRVDIIKSLRGSDGYLPSAPLVEGRDGYLYGTTQLGGRSDAGAIFRLLKSGAGHTVLRNAPLPDAGARMQVGRGTYEVPAVLRLRGGNIQMTGAGMDQTVIKRADGLAVRDEAVIRGVYYSGLAGGGFAVSDLTVDCNLQGQTTQVNAGGVILAGSRNRISRVRGINWGSRIPGSECFVLGIGVAGGGELTEHFIHGEGHENVIENCLVDTPAPVVHFDGVTAIGINGGVAPNYFLPGNGWCFHPIIRNCTVRGSTDLANSPVYLHGYSISITKGGVVRNNVAEDLLKDSGGYCGFYHDTGSIFDAFIYRNSFIRCTRGVVFYNHTTTAVVQRGIHVYDNELESPPNLAESAGVHLTAGNLNEVHELFVMRNRIRARVGIHVESVLPATGVQILGNTIDATTPWSLRNVPAPVILNNRNSAGRPLPTR